jgi:hypothetical protein
MWRSSRASVGADPFRRSLKYASGTDLIGDVGESLHLNVRAFLRLSALEQRVLFFSLNVAVGLVACTGVILAMLTWTGAGL